MGYEMVGSEVQGMLGLTMSELQAEREADVEALEECLRDLDAAETELRQAEAEQPKAANQALGWEVDRLKGQKIDLQRQIDYLEEKLDRMYRLAPKAARPHSPISVITSGGNGADIDITAVVNLADSYERATARADKAEDRLWAACKWASGIASTLAAALVASALVFPSNPGGEKFGLGSFLFAVFSFGLLNMILFSERVRKESWQYESNSLIRLSLVGLIAPVGTFVLWQAAGS